MSEKLTVGRIEFSLQGVGAEAMPIAPSPIGQVLHTDATLKKTVAAERARLHELYRPLVEALQHMRVCQICADGPWSDCAGGLGHAALSRIEKELKREAIQQAAQEQP